MVLRWESHWKYPVDLTINMEIHQSSLDKDSSGYCQPRVSTTATTRPFGNQFWQRETLQLRFYRGLDRKIIELGENIFSVAEFSMFSQEKDIGAEKYSAVSHLDGWSPQWVSLWKHMGIPSTCVSIVWNHKKQKGSEEIARVWHEEIASAWAPMSNVDLRWYS